MEIVLEAGLAGARAGTQCVARLVNGEMGHGTSDFFFGLGIGEMSGARVLVRCFSPV